jgi:hypothetical protein
LVVVDAASVDAASVAEVVSVMDAVVLAHAC